MRFEDFAERRTGRADFCEQNSWKNCEAKSWRFLCINRAIWSKNLEKFSKFRFWWHHWGILLQVSRLKIEKTKFCLLSILWHPLTKPWLSLHWCHRIKPLLIGHQQQQQQQQKKKKKPHDPLVYLANGRYEARKISSSNHRHVPAARLELQWLVARSSL